MGFYNYLWIFMGIYTNLFIFYIASMLKLFDDLNATEKSRVNLLHMLLLNEIILIQNCFARNTTKVWKVSRIKSNQKKNQKKEFKDTKDKNYCVGQIKTIWEIIITIKAYKSWASHKCETYFEVAFQKQLKPHVYNCMLQIQLKLNLFSLLFVFGKIVSVYVFFFLNLIITSLFICNNFFKCLVIVWKLSFIKINWAHQKRHSRQGYNLVCIEGSWNILFHWNKRICAIH